MFVCESYQIWAVFPRLMIYDLLHHVCTGTAYKALLKPSYHTPKHPKTRYLIKHKILYIRLFCVCFDASYFNGANRWNKKSLIQCTSLDLMIKTCSQTLTSRVTDTATQGMWLSVVSSKADSSEQMEQPVCATRPALFVHLPLLFCWFVYFWFLYNQEPLERKVRRDPDIIRRWQRTRGTAWDRTPRACSSRMPGMAQGSQWHEPPTLNKRLAVVCGPDPVSS